MEQTEQEVTLDLKELYELIRSKIYFILSITVGFALIAGIISYFVIPPTFEANTTILIGKAPTTNDQDKVQYDDVLMYEKLSKTYAQIAKSRLVLERTIQSLKKDTTPEVLLRQVTVTPQADTQVMTISVDSGDPYDAMNTANTLSKTFIDEATRLYPTGSVQIIDAAVFPDKPIKPKKLLNVAIAFFLGLMVSVGIVILIDYLDNTIKSETDIERYVDLPIIGIIPKYKE